MTTKPLAWRTSPALHSQHEKAERFGVTLPESCTRELAQTIIDAAEEAARMARIEETALRGVYRAEDELDAGDDAYWSDMDVMGPDDHDEEGA